VVCVGNIHSGGSGKTPLVIEIARHYENPGAVILSRGYRGTLSNQGASVNRESSNGAELFGDEPWMIANCLASPVYIGRERARVIKDIERHHPTSVVILDDGFQHLALARDVDIVAINTDKNPCDTFCLPWGELREPLSALRSASAVVLLGETSGSPGVKQWGELVSQCAPTLEQFVALRRNKGIWNGENTIEPTAENTFVAFCGLAHHAGFESTVRRIPRATFVKGFPDHHSYGDSDIDFLIAERKRLGLSSFLTTDKDFFKVREAFRRRGEPLYSLRIEYVLPPEFWYFLDKRMR